MSITPYTPRPGTTPRSTSFVFDTSSLDTLRRQVNTDGKDAKEAEMEVAKQFEALFVQMMLKQSRQSAMPGGLLDSEQGKMIQGMHDEQMAMNLSQGQGMGLAQSIFDLMQANKADINEDEAMHPAAGNPMASSSRLPGLKSQMPLEGDNVADSLDALVNLVMNGAESTVKAVRSAVRTVSEILPSSSAPKRVAEFVKKVGDAAVAVARDSGIPAQLIMSQAALESGWGRQEIKHPSGETSYNLFGIKATGGWKGKVVHVMTTEYIDGVARKISQPFRAYDSYEDSLADYARLISTSKRYASVMEADTPQQAAREVQRSGYATDPKYAEKLISIMDHFKTV